jgi:hypothetical protein
MHRENPRRLTIWNEGSNIMKCVHFKCLSKDFMRIMALMSSQYYAHNTTDLFSSWTNASKIPGAVLEVDIMDQPSC